MSWPRRLRVYVGQLFPAWLHRNEPALPSRAVVRFSNRRGTTELWIKEGKQAAHWTRLSCHRFRANEVHLQLSVLAPPWRRSPTVGFRAVGGAR